MTTALVGYYDYDSLRLRYRANAAPAALDAYVLYEQPGEPGGLQHHGRRDPAAVLRHEPREGLALRPARRRPWQHGLRGVPLLRLPLRRQALPLRRGAWRPGDERGRRVHGRDLHPGERRGRGRRPRDHAGGGVVVRPPRRPRWELRDEH